MKPYRIAQVGSIWERTPPPLYGGTERIVSTLTEGLVKSGHKVTLFATGDSVTQAHLSSVYPSPLFRDGIPWTDLMYPLLHLSQVFDRAHEFDIIHVHLNKSSDYISLPLARKVQSNVVFTMHFPYPLSQKRQGRHLVLQKYSDLNYISISDSQRKGGENLNWLKTIYNGINMKPYTFHKQPGSYLVWLGKFNPDKGVKEAIDVSKRSGMKLLLAGKIDSLEKEDYQYYQEVVKPQIDGKSVEYIGEVGDYEKNDLLGNAYAFLNPIKWNEPFGLVMIEAMATGTPVISFSEGAAPEIITKNTGFLVKDIEEMASRVDEVHTIDREKCRKHIEKRFSSDVMVKNYEHIYTQLA